MNSHIVALLLVAALFTSSVTGARDPALLPPARPSEFNSRAEFIQYIRALNEYYAMVGRPRLVILRFSLTCFLFYHFGLYVLRV